MAGGALGSLTVKLGLDAAEFTGGLSKADHQARQFGENVGRVIGQGIQLAVTSFAAFTTAGTAAFIAADKLIKQVGDYQDMAEKIGGSAEALASFGVALGTAGTTSETLATAMVKLTKNLTGVDDESKSAGAAIAALGLDLADFKKLEPEKQIEAISKALATFADGAEKTAVLEGLVKGGAQLLPFLKALEEQGGRQVILTAEQIAQADEYADKVARVTAEFTQQAQAAATQLIPTLSDAFDVVTDLVRAFAESESALTLFKVAVGAVLVPLQTIAVVGANVAFVFLGVGREIGAVAAQLAALARGDITGFRAISDAVKEDGVRARAELDAFEKRVMSVGQRGAGSDFDDSAARTGRPRLAFDGAQKADASAKKAAAAAKSTLADAERYIEALRKQDEKTEELTATEKVLSDIQAGRFVAAGKFTEAEALRLAGEIDASKELVIQLKARREAAIAEGDAINKANEIRQTALKQMLDATPGAKLEKQRADVQLLTEEFEAGRLSEEKYLETVTSRLDLTGEKLKNTKTAAEEVGLAFNSAFEDAAVAGKSFGEVLKGLGQDLLKLALRKSVTEPLFNAVSSSGIFDSIAGLFGGGKAGGGPVDAGRLYRVNENGPEMLDVNGSQYLMMGSKGGTVRPGSQMGGGSGGMTINVGAGASRAEVIAAVQQGVATSVGLVAESNRRRGSV
jgi:hypothetical protein